MYDKNSDYALNKMDKDAIVYKSVSGTYRLTRTDFDSEEDFIRWKAAPDEDYRNTEYNQLEDDRCLSLNEDLDVFCFSAEDVLFSRLREKEETEIRAKMVAKVKSFITERQYRRLWMYCVKGMTVLEIGSIEGIAHQNVSKSIRAARKKVLRIFSKQGAKKPI